MTKRSRILTILFVLALILILSYRSIGSAQTIESLYTIDLLRSLEQRLSRIGLEGEYFDTVSSNNRDSIIDLMTSNESFYLVPDNGSVRVERLADLLSGLEDADEVRSYLRDTLDRRLKIGDLVLQVSSGTDETLISVSQDGTRSSGLLAILSRLPSRNGEESFSGNSLASDSFKREYCKHHVITRDIFGREAESVDVCATAYCVESVINACVTSRVGFSRGYFGQVAISPDTAPSPGQVDGAICRAPLTFEWKVTLPPVDIAGIKLDLGRFGFGGSGSFVAETGCLNRI